MPLWPDHLDFMVSTHHPLAQSAQLDLKTLSEHPAILPGLNTYTGQIIKKLFDRHQLTLQVSIATNYLETIRMMASVGLGWTVLPRSMMDDSLVSLPVSDASIQRTLGIVYHQGRSLSRAAKAFINALETSAGTAPASASV